MLRLCHNTRVSGQFWSAIIGCTTDINWHLAMTGWMSAIEHVIICCVLTENLTLCGTLTRGLGRDHLLLMIVIINVIDFKVIMMIGVCRNHWIFSTWSIYLPFILNDQLIDSWNSDMNTSCLLVMQCTESWKAFSIMQPHIQSFSLQCVLCFKFRNDICFSCEKDQYKS